MSKISVVMPTYNAERYVKEAIESVLNQSFGDFEYIIVDDGSSDDTMSIIRSFSDKRIKIFENKHDFIGSLNIGIRSASGKYIARMDADDLMYCERLKIQYKIMEEEPELAVCTSWVRTFGENIAGNILPSYVGVLKYPLYHLLQGNFLFHPTALIRTSFLYEHILEYQNYEFAEDYKLWVEIAKRGGLFYIESQPLLFYRINTEQVSYQKRKEQAETALRIRWEILTYLLKLNSNHYPNLSLMLESMSLAKNQGLLTDDRILSFFYDLFSENQSRFILES